MLMGKGEAAARRAWLEEHGNEDRSGYLMTDRYAKSDVGWAAAAGYRAPSPAMMSGQRRTKGTAAPTLKHDPSKPLRTTLFGAPSRPATTPKR
jgi:hypothetical protein